LPARENKCRLKTSTPWEMSSQDTVHQAEP
jgi:hypothetical protein